MKSRALGEASLTALCGGKPQAEKKDPRTNTNAIVQNKKAATSAASLSVPIKSVRSYCRASFDSAPLTLAEANFNSLPNPFKRMLPFIPLAEIDGPPLPILAL